MKVIVLACAMLASTQYVSVTGNDLGVEVSARKLIDKVSVRPEDLPEAVKSTLAGSYSEWKVSSAFLVTKEDNSQYYEVNIKKGEESATVNLDKYGKKLD
jgi:hypothetical protein